QTFQQVLQVGRVGESRRGRRRLLGLWRIGAETHGGEQEQERRQRQPDEPRATVWLHYLRHDGPPRTVGLRTPARADTAMPRPLLESTVSGKKSIVLLGDCYAARRAVRFCQAPRNRRSFRRVTSRHTPRRSSPRSAWPPLRLPCCRRRRSSS